MKCAVCRIVHGINVDDNRKSEDREKWNENKSEKKL